VLAKVGVMYLYTGCWLKSVSCIYIQGVGYNRCHVFIYSVLVKVGVMYLIQVFFKVCAMYLYIEGVD
jgi:hypothetical protein